MRAAWACLAAGAALMWAGCANDAPIVNPGQGDFNYCPPCEDQGTGGVGRGTVFRPGDPNTEPDPGRFVAADVPDPSEIGESGSDTGETVGTDEEVNPFFPPDAEQPDDTGDTGEDTGGDTEGDSGTDTDDTGTGFCRQRGLHLRAGSGRQAGATWARGACRTRGAARRDRTAGAEG